MQTSCFNTDGTPEMPARSADCVCVANATEQTTQGGTGGTASEDGAAAVGIGITVFVSVLVLVGALIYKYWKRLERGKRASHPAGFTATGRPVPNEQSNSASQGPVPGPAASNIGKERVPQAEQLDLPAGAVVEGSPAELARVMQDMFDAGDLLVNLHHEKACLRAQIEHNMHRPLKFRESHWRRLMAVYHPDKSVGRPEAVARRGADLLAFLQSFEGQYLAAEDNRV